MKRIIFVSCILCLSTSAYAGLFDSIVSQVQQTAQQQQAAQQKAEQQQTAQQESQAADQQADQDRAKLDAANNAAQQQYQAQQQQAAQEQAARETQDQSPQPVNPNRAPFKCKYSDFNWGDTVMSTKAKLMLKGKQIKEAGSITMVNVGEVKGRFLTYDDVLFEMPCTVTLGFSLKTGKFGLVNIDLPANGALDSLSGALTKKYGEPDQQGQGGSMWGGTQNNEDTLSLTINYVTGGNEFLLEYLSGEFFPLLKSESEEKTNSLVNQDAAKL